MAVAKNINYMTGKMGVCQLCLQQKKLIQAHIMPKCFQKPIRASDNSFLLYHAKTNRYQDVKDFLFDKSLLCAGCDNSFSAAENYTARFFDNIRKGELRPNKVVRQEDGTDYYYSPDIFQIKNALLSILWRMSVTKKEQYKYVDLQSLQDGLRDRLNQDSIMEPGFFPFTIITLQNLGDARADLMSTYVPSFDHLGSKVFLFQLPEFLVFIHATIAPTFDPATTSVVDDSTLVIVEEKENGSIRHLDNLYFIPFIPKSTR